MVRRHRFLFTLFALAALLFGLDRFAQADKVSVEKLNKTIDDFTLADAKGKSVSLHGIKEKKAVVVVFLSFECPVCTGYAPALIDLHKTYSGRGIEFLGICPNNDLTPAQLADKAAEYRLPFPVLQDPKAVAADALKAQTTPEAFVLDQNFVLRYRGRIDNAYAARLKKNPQTTESNLKQTLDELLAGKEVSVPATQAVGCPISRHKETVKTGRVTFYRDVLPIVQTHCQQCHRRGEVGPFALETYEQAVNWGQSIKDYTQDHKMPPWKPVDGPAFHNERKLTAQELKTLADWVDSDTPEGVSEDAPPARKFVNGWQLGQPDLVLTVPEEMTVGASGRDLFRVVVLPTGLTEDKFVTAFEVRPGNPRVLHHTLNFFETSGTARKLETKERERVKKPDENDAGPGYTVAMGLGFTPKPTEFGGLGGWAPGQLGRALPDGTGYLLPKGADVLIQMHYHRTGRVEKDKTSIGLYFAKKPVQKTFKAAVIPGTFLFIPSGEERFPVRGAIELQQDMKLYTVMHHMHMLGREAKITVTPPEGKPWTLLAIKDWDYNWQETYILKQPVDLKAGTKLAVEALYDNTQKNPNNPFNPARMVIFGEQTDNEMCFVFLGGTSDGAGGRIRTKRVDYDAKPTVPEKPK
jgi:peroxiredoxin